MLEAQQVWGGHDAGFRPEHEVNVRRHIGDYTLFMTGIFPERVQHEATTGFYIAQGKRAYRFVSEHGACLVQPGHAARIAGSPSASRATPARSTTRARVHFPEHPARPSSCSAAGIAEARRGPYRLPQPDGPLATARLRRTPCRPRRLDEGTVETSSRASRTSTRPPRCRR